MAKNGTKGGFLRGALYGFLLSIVAFVALVYLFPMTLDGPEHDEVDIVQVGPQGVDVSSDDNSGAGVVIGGAGDSPPATIVQTPVVDEQQVQDPVVENQSADRPIVGSGSDGAVTEESSTDLAAEPVIVTAGEDNNTGNSTPPAALEPVANGNAFDVFSVSTDIDPNKKLMAIVLVDTLDGDLQALLDTDLPFTFAVPADAQATSSAQRLSQMGYEVLAMLPDDVPAGGDVAGRINGYLENVPVSVAVLDNNLVSLLRDAEKSAALFEAVTVSGHGVVSFVGAGDEQAQNLAVANGVPFGTVARIIDSDPDPRAIQESLKQALIQSLTSGSSIVFARTSETTIETLTEWLESDRLNFIQIVPVSVIMKQ